MSNIKEVTITISKPLEVKWECPECKKMNTEEFYSTPERVRLQCDYCGRMFIGVRT